MKNWEFEANKGQCYHGHSDSTLIDERSHRRQRSPSPIQSPPKRAAERTQQRRLLRYLGTDHHARALRPVRLGGPRVGQEGRAALGAGGLRGTLHRLRCPRGAGPLPAAAGAVWREGGRDSGPGCGG